MSVEVLQFDAKTVPLRGVNLIEASAGTGKTYSIAILVLRLLLEVDIDVIEAGKPTRRRLSIKELLMVTFTKAAVAELEERVRKFIRKAYQVLEEGAGDDGTINEIVQQAVELKGSQEVENRLKDAITFLDEAAVQTIHSFCQQMLREFAFETRQSFSVELVSDIDDIMNAVVNQFWRSQVAVMPVDILQFFGDNLSRVSIKEVVAKYLEGKPIYGYQVNQDYQLDEAFFQQCRDQQVLLTEQMEALYQQMLPLCEDATALEAACIKERYAKALLVEHVHNPEAFMDVFITKQKSDKPPAYLKKLFPEIFDLVEQYLAVEKILDQNKIELSHHIFGAAIDFVTPSIQRYKAQKGLLSFDDLIDQMHARLCEEENPGLVKAIRNKYKVVFIDEFQDTDRKQYEIFNTAFGHDTIVFYIGDPKQSIYAFRKADIDTYLQAADEVDTKYGMHVNYRSATNFILAMNQFFKPVADFDTFNYGQAPRGIYYHEVKAPEDNNKGVLHENGAPIQPIRIISSAKKEGVEQALISQVGELLSGRYQIAKEGAAPRAVSPKDIGILVRANKDAKPIKEGLSRLGIPSVVIGDAKILQSTEARELLYVLEAIQGQNRNLINRALLTSFTGMDLPTVLTEQDMVTIGRFSNYKDQWEKAGVYKALFTFIADYGVEAYLTSPKAEAGERVLSNLYQLIELLYKQQTVKGLSQAELMDWLRRSIEDQKVKGDEYEQRIESDEACVTIITVHKSKGLQYNIVLTSAMDLTAMNGKEKFLELKNEAGVEEVRLKALMTEEQMERYINLKLQENRRMIYVNLTRAVYGSFIFSTLKSKDSAFAAFVEAFDSHPQPGIAFVEPVELPKGFRYQRQGGGQSIETASPAKEVYFELLSPGWRRLSYTYLAASSTAVGKFEPRQIMNSYDEFVFLGLKKGAVTGNLLHEIFERTYFERPAYWPDTVSRVVQRYHPSDPTYYETHLLEMLTHISEASIATAWGSFSLKETVYEERLNEFEFDFPVASFSAEDLNELLKGQGAVQLAANSSWEGMMNGKIDMFFRRAGQYYVLDWKSTYLGEGLEDYQKDKLAEEMSRHNYHLQYLIYTVATVKYLRDRLSSFDYDRDFGGVLYYFVRGVRAGKDLGIYYVKPPKELIEMLFGLWATRPALEGQ